MMFTNKLVRIINTKTLVNITIRVFGHNTENFERYFIHSKLTEEFVGHASTPQNKIGKRLVLKISPVRELTVDL